MKQTANQYGKTQRKLYLVVGQSWVDNDRDELYYVGTSRTKARQMKGDGIGGRIVEVPLTKQALTELNGVWF